MKLAKSNPRFALRLLSSLTLATLHLACGADLLPRDAVAVRDSAGVRIVELRRSVWEHSTHWRLQAEPELEIGVADGAPEYQLFQVNDAARLADGRIAVANTGSNEVRLYAADGSFLAALGGAGDGPGEFRRLANVAALPGDSILAYDPLAARITIFTSAGEVASTTRFVHRIPGGILAPARLEDGSYLFGVGWSSAELKPTQYRAGTLQRGRSPILRFASDGALQDTVGVFAGLEIAIWDQGGKISMGPAIFGRKLAHAVAHDRVYVGTQERFEIGVYRPDGTLTEKIRVRGGVLEVNDAMLAEYRERMLALAAGAPPELISDFEQYIDAQPKPRSLPAHGPLHVDAEGNLWVGRYDLLGGDPTRYAILGPDGTPRAVVDLPERFHIFEIGHDYLLGRWLDESEVEYIRLYRLEKQS